MVLNVPTVDVIDPAVMVVDVRAPILAFVVLRLLIVVLLA